MMFARHRHVAGLRLIADRRRAFFSGAAAIATAVGATETGAALAGIAATTAGTIGGTALAGAAIGATTGAITGGNVGKDALYGGLAGAAGGAGAEALGYSGADLAGLLGGSSAGASNAVTSSDVLGATSGGIPTAAEEQAAALGTGSGGIPTAAQEQMANLDNALGLGSSGRSTLNPVSAGSGALSGVGKSISGTSLALGALAAGAQLLAKPAASAAPPGPASTAATQGPYFNTPLQPYTGTSRSMLTPQAPTVGQAQAMYFGNNSASNYGLAYAPTPGSPTPTPGMARGGRVAHYDTGGSAGATGASGTNTAAEKQTILNDYQTLLGRTPNQDELNFYLNASNNGYSDAQIQQFFVNSPEYKADQSAAAPTPVAATPPPAPTPSPVAPTPRPAPTPSGSGALSQASATQPSPAASPAAAPPPAPTPSNISAGVTQPETEQVVQDYSQYLGRTPTNDEVAFYDTAFANGYTDSQITQMFLNSPEYKADVASGKVDPTTGYTTALAGQPIGQQTLPNGQTIGIGTLGGTAAGTDAYGGSLTPPPAPSTAPTTTPTPSTTSSGTLSGQTSISPTPSPPSFGNGQTLSPSSFTSGFQQATHQLPQALSAQWNNGAPALGQSTNSNLWNASGNATTTQDFDNLLGRDPTQNDLNYYTDAQYSQGMTPALEQQYIKNSPEYKALNPPAPGLAKGGALALAAYPHLAAGGGQKVFNTDGGEHYVEGPGDGQEDQVNAKLSDGEWVADAQFVSALGGGSNRKGAQRLEQVRNYVLNKAHSQKFLPKNLGKGALSKLAGEKNVIQ